MMGENKVIKILNEYGWKALLVRSTSYLIYLIKRSLSIFLVNLSKFFLRKYHFVKLKDVLKNHSNKRVIVLKGTHSWYYQMFQRPHQLALALSDEKILIFYTYDKEVNCFLKGFKEINSGCYITFYLNELIEYLKDYIIYFNSYDINFDYKSVIKNNAKLWYDYLDEIHTDINQTEINESGIERHNKILSEENIIISASAQDLYEKIAKVRKENYFLAENGVDVNHFNIERDVNRIPKEMKRIISKQKKIVGYYGTLAKWLDYDLVLYCIENLPEYEFVFIGLKGDNEIDKYDFQNYNNFNILKPVSYDELHLYAVWFDVCIIPFKVYEVTRATSPIKLFEYMSLGLPIVTTDLPECRKYPIVKIAKNKNDFIEKLKESAEFLNDNEFRDKSLVLAKMNTWEVRAKTILQNLGN